MNDIELAKRAIVDVAFEDQGIDVAYHCGEYIGVYTETEIPGVGDTAMVEVNHRDDTSPEIVVPSSRADLYTQVFNREGVEWQAKARKKLGLRVEVVTDNEK